MQLQQKSQSLINLFQAQLSGKILHKLFLNHRVDVRFKQSVITDLPKLNG